MPTNDQVVLDHIMSQRHKEIAPELDEHHFFSLFATEQVLRSFDLSYDEIAAGTVDGGGDGGVDAVYIFLNGQLLADDYEIDRGLRGATIDLVLLQNKHQASFSEAPLEKLAVSLSQLLDLSTDITGLKKTFNARVLDSFGRFRDLFLALSPNFPKVHIRVAYVTRGARPHPNVTRHVATIEGIIRTAFNDAVVTCELVGASELLQIAQKTPAQALQLTVVENISTENVGFACLVRLTDFFEFITEDGAPRSTLFEANVRDYAGDVEVNAAIRRSLEARDGEDFWWLNNGVTIVASQASLAGKTLTIQDPQVVNGLQTSTEIMNYLAALNDPHDDRHVLVRVLVPSNDESRDRIIRATNSQTAIGPASLRATDPVHRKIEDYLKSHNLFYERRKNYYKNLGKPKDQIVSIPYLAQAVMAIALHEPNNARARPSSLLKKDEEYRRVFSADYPIALYLRASEVMRTVDQFLLDRTSLSAAERNNAKFHVAYAAVALAVGSLDPSPDHIAALEVSGLDDASLNAALERVMAVFAVLQGHGAHSTPDQVAKSRTTVERLQRELSATAGITLSTDAQARFRF